MRFAKNLLKKVLRALPAKQLLAVSDFLFAARNKINDQIRWKTAGASPLPEILSFDGSERLSHSMIEDSTPWDDHSPDHSDIPGMISPEECQYYKYITRFYSGAGAIVELGPWLGRSTSCILQGLSQNPNFRNKKLYVFDDFVWRPEWMNRKAPAGVNLGEGADFQPLFESYTNPWKHHLTVQKRRIYNTTEKRHVPELSWNEGPVEMMIVDCGRTHEGNQAWFNIFSPSFIPNRTLLVLQDWCTHREIPVRWYNQINDFVDSKGATLQPVHELKWGCAATFLVRTL